MRSIDWNTVFTGIALVLSIASPVITSVINSFSQRREREVIFYLHHRAEVIERYVKSTGAIIHWNDKESQIEYGKSYGEILLYVSGSLRTSIESLNYRISNWGNLSDDDFKSMQMSFNDICKALSENSPRVKTKKRYRIAK